MNNDQLLDLWARDDHNIAERDRILAEMETRHLRPEKWIETRALAYGLYPDVSDPNFAARLARKTEFYELASKPVDEDTCTRSSKEFDTTSVQQLITRFLHPDTPYNGILLYHGVGVGKTCTAITAAETFLDVMPAAKVYIIAPQAIADGFRRTIFDVNKLVPTTKEEYALTKEVWKSPQCTGMTYVRLANQAQNEKREEVAKEVEKLIKQRYKIMGYLAFANWIIAKFREIPEVITGQALHDRKVALLQELFADHLLIIDEAHNLRDADTDAGAEIPADEPDRAKLTELAEGKRLTPILQEILRVAEGLRLMLMSATPMYNTAQEIIFLMNLLTLNDTKDDMLRLEVGKVFRADGQFKEGGADELAKRIKRYVSYMRGENPNTFPLRLPPPEKAGMAFMEMYPIYSISRREGLARGSLTEDDKKIMANLPLVVHNVGDLKVGRGLLKYLIRHRNPDRVDNTENRGVEVSDFILDQTMQMGNITYPNGMFGSRGWEMYFKESSTQFKGSKVKQYRWVQPPEEAAEEIIAVTDVFQGGGLRNWAPKIHAIVKSITESAGISFVYSRYIKAGALPIAIALELAGWCRVLADGTPAPLLIHSREKPTNYYVLLTSDDTLSPNFAGLLRYATQLTPATAASGSKIKAVIGSQVASEGLDLKCIREIHLLDGWYHLNRIEQIVGRGVRYCSHVDLPPELRNSTIYLHVVNLHEYETADLYAYRLAVRKAQPIGRVTRLMKVNAWDCMLNIDAILLENVTREVIPSYAPDGSEPMMVSAKDEPYTSFCDFSGSCAYQCSAKIASDQLGTDMSTAEEYDFQRRFREKQDMIIEIFKTETALPLESIQAMVYEDIPPFFLKVALREMLHKVKIHRPDGIYGTLKLVNGYIVFQPEGVTDTQIPLPFRYGRAYGRMPRSFDLLRKTLIDVSAVAAPAAAPVAAPAAAPVAAPEPVAEEIPEPPVEPVGEADVTRISALADLAEWDRLLNLFLTQKAGPIAQPSKWPDLTGWRWLFYYFRSPEILETDTKPIAYRWFMDNFWTFEQHLAVFRYWLAQGIDTLTGYERICAYTYMMPGRIELFEGRLGGCAVYNTNINKVQTYCYTDGDFSQCTKFLESEVQNILGNPVNRETDTGEYFGLLTTKQKTIIFKTVDKVKGSMKGTECANTSNLQNHQLRIRAIQDILRNAGTSIAPFLLDSSPVEKIDEPIHKKRQDILKKQYTAAGAAFAIDLEHIADLSLKQICPYMEFLLRYADRQNMNGKRWFLSLVESARA